MAARFPGVDVDRMMAHIEHLAVNIGERLAGSEQEQQAAGYVQQQMEQLGLQNVQQQSFTCKWFRIDKAVMQARIGNVWEVITMDACAHTPCTDGVLEAELVYIENASDMIVDPLDLRGKVVLVHGSYGPNSRILKKLAEKQIAAAIWTDVRYTAPWNLRVGLPFTFLHLLTFPAASVPHPVEWDLVRRGADRVRLDLKAVVEDRLSQNVIGEIPGRSPDGGVIVTGHHDSVIGTVGAEDNAAGVGIALAIAEALRGMEFHKPVRFASFGTEEQLSQGAFDYVAKDTNRAQSLDMVLNVDGQGCWAGSNEIYLTGSPELRAWTQARMDEARWSGRILEEPDGFSDHFPFIVRDVPAAWFHRRNCAGGRWFHHSQFDNMSALNPEVLEACANLMGQMAVEICSSPELPFDRTFPPDVREAVRQVADGWLNP